MTLPEVINGYNVYDGNSKKLIGISDEVSLPSVDSKTTTISGAGILGDFDATVIGQFNGMEMEVPFRMLYGDVFKLFKLDEVAKLTLRGSEQTMKDGEIKHIPLKVSVRGMAKTLEPGKVKNGEPTGSSVKLSLYYIKILLDGKEKLYIDILNNKFKVNGKDMLSKINKNC